MTREGQPFLTFNGIETQSAQTYNLIQDIEDLSHVGVDVLRISPQSENTFAIVDLFRDCLNGTMTPQQTAQHMDTLMPSAPCNGYWHGQPGLAQVASCNSLAKA